MENNNILNKRILLLTNYLGKVYGRTFLQKFFFLVSKEFDDKENPRYIKYHYGPFSMDVVDEINLLISEELIKEQSKKFKNGVEGHFYELTEKGTKKVKEIEKEMDKIQLENFKGFCEKYQDYSPSELLKLVYLKYPEWAVNSKLVQE